MEKTPNTETNDLLIDPELIKTGDCQELSSAYISDLDTSPENLGNNVIPINRSVHDAPKESIRRHPSNPEPTD
jgi:hypothetical protein